MKPRDIIFAPEAEADLLWIYDTIAAAADPLTAFRYIERIEQKCSMLDLGSERVEIPRVLYGGANWKEEM